LANQERLLSFFVSFPAERLNRAIEFFLPRSSGALCHTQPSVEKACGPFGHGSAGEVLREFTFNLNHLELPLNRSITGFPCTLGNLPQFNDCYETYSHGGASGNDRARLCTGMGLEADSQPAGHMHRQ
jgi:hypothetical protein